MRPRSGQGGAVSRRRTRISTLDIYPDEITRTTAGALAEAETFRFDLSDLQPAAFGATPGQGLFKLFSDFVANPNDIDKITQQMEAAATKAYQ